jgi:hypothetical protein
MSKSIPLASHAPPVSKLPRALLIGGALAAVAFVAVLVAAGVGVGVYYFQMPPSSPRAANIVGKWEIENHGGGFEFAADGTGKQFAPAVPGLQVAPTDLRWKVETTGKAPMLVMVMGKEWPGRGMNTKLDRMLFERDGDVLTLGVALRMRKLD